MPQTVPKRPIKGAVLAVVASRAKEERSRPISSAIPKCRARRTLSFKSLSASPVPLMRLNSRTARRVTPKSGERISSSSLSRAIRSERASSKAARPSPARFRAARRASHLPAIKAQLNTDIMSSRHSTHFETRVASAMALIMASMFAFRPKPVNCAKGYGTHCTQPRACRSPDSGQCPQGPGRSKSTVAFACILFSPFWDDTSRLAHRNKQLS